VGVTNRREVFELRLWFVSHEVITSASPTEKFKICVSGAYFRGIWFLECGGHVTDRHNRDFAAFVRSVGRSARWLRRMLRCNSGRALLVPHPAAEPLFDAGDEKTAYLEDMQVRLCHRPEDLFGHYLALVNFGGVGPLLSLAPAALATASADLVLEADSLTPARAPLSPEMAARCATQRMLTYEYPPVVHKQQCMLQAYPCHSSQGTTYVMMTAAIVLWLLRAYRKTNLVINRAPCYYFLTGNLSVREFAPGDGAVADALAEYDAIVRTVPWAAVHNRVPYHNDPNRHTPTTLLPYQVGTVVDRRCHYVRDVSVPRTPQAPVGVVLTPWVGAAAGCGGGGWVFFGVLTGPSRGAKWRTESGRAAWEPPTGRKARRRKETARGFLTRRTTALRVGTNAVRTGPGR